MPKTGFLTASDFSSLMVAADLKKGIDHFGKGALTLADTIAMKMMDVVFDEDYASAAMQRGIEYEPIAISEYEVEKMVEVHSKQHFTVDSKQPFLACHPDGRVGSDIIIEVKCPNQSNHLNNLIHGAQYHSDYTDQCQGVAMICGASWIDFVSFDDRFPTGLQLSVHRFPADPLWQEKFRQRAELFWKIVESKVETLKSYIKP